MYSTFKKKKAPPGIKIIFVLLLLYLIYFLISGLYSSLSSLVKGDLLKQFEKEDSDKVQEIKERIENMGFEYTEDILRGLIILGIIIILLVSFLIFKILQGFWNRKNWSRVLLIIVFFFLAFGGTISIFIDALYNLIFVLLYLIMGIYLLIDKNVKRYFINN